jgi:hypothetical protein
MCQRTGTSFAQRLGTLKSEVKFLLEFIPTSLWILYCTQAEFMFLK